MNLEHQPNIDNATVASFGDEWSRFDQTQLSEDERARIFAQYFAIFPWQDLGLNPQGFDMGCGSGRWAKLVAPRIGLLNCIDPSTEALAVARRNLACLTNVRFCEGSVDNVPLSEGSQDFGYSLGVLHHIPDTAAALMSCVRLLKSGAPFLLYLYYRFDNRPLWFRFIWRASEVVRSVVSRLPARVKGLVTDAVALLIYLPLARLAWVVEKLGFGLGNLPLSFYRNTSFYTMRTDSRDRFGTPLEQRFTRVEIKAMMERAGLVEVRFSEAAPYWCAVGIKV